MQRLTTWMKRHVEMTMTICSGLLILIGMGLKFMNLETGAIISFIVAFLVGGYHAAKAGVVELVEDRHLNVDVLMILAAIGAALIGYWEEGAMLIFIFSLAESLEDMAMERTKDSITALMQVTPDVARRYNDAGEIEIVATNELAVNDRIQVRKGEAVPIDGYLLSPVAVINQASVTGESVPVNLTTGDEVIGGTINEAESFDFEVSVENEDTLFAKIIKMVEEAQDSPSRTASRINAIEDTYVKIVLIGVPIFIVLMHYLANLSWNDAFYRGMILLTVASPCALVASASPASLSAISRGTRQGILFKGGSALERLNDVQAIIFDKTGTLTVGELEVSSIYYHDPKQEAYINQIVKAVESTSTHPIAQAILHRLKSTDLIELDHYTDITGKGFKIEHQGKKWRVGNRQFALKDDQVNFSKEERIQAEQLESQGQTVIFVSCDDQLMAYFALEDTLKEDAIASIQALNDRGIHTVMLTGDNPRTAQHIADVLGIQEVYAGLLPDEKANIVKELQNKYEAVAMVGDGINDAPALATAEVGFAMGSGTDIAMETADVVLIQDDLEQINFSLGLANKTNRITMFNIFFSLSVIALLIIANIMQSISLPLGVIGHEGSTILVILNGLRLLAYRGE